MAATGSSIGSTRTGAWWSSRRSGTARPPTDPGEPEGTRVAARPRIGRQLSALPNLLYTDGNSFALWRSGELVGKVHLDGDVETSGAKLRPNPGLLGMVEDFLQWEPLPPKTPKHLAETSARLCRLLREEVTEQLERHDPALTDLAEDWRHLLFPDATDDEFADGYAQAVTFGLLLARARGIDLDKGIDAAAQELGKNHSLIGRALRVLTDKAVQDDALTTSVATLTRVLAVVDWPTIAKGDPEVWLYFYETFLAEYDAQLRQRTGSYYTPVEVVEAMTALVDEAVRERFDLPAALADEIVTLVDPAMGTGTFLLSLLRRIASYIAEDLGEGAVPAAITAALRKLIGFELQLGPFAVAQLRVLAELAELGVDSPGQDALRMFVTNTLDNPFVEDVKLGSWYEPIARSRREANQIKKGEPVFVVIGNPPYKAKSRDQGAWIVAGESNAPGHAPLHDFIPPPEWGVGAHVKHLYNPYVYFWRWALWKVFDHHSDDDRGVICLITMAGFLDGPGFQRMRDYLRRRADGIWVIDCSPEGHQPPVATRIFQGVQQPVCIMRAVRDGSTSTDEPAPVRFRSLSKGPRTAKFAELATFALNDKSWEPCPAEWRAPFLPASEERWVSFPSLDDLLRWSGSGVMPGRTWVVAPDAETLRWRWRELIDAKPERKPTLFLEHKTDRRVDTVLADGLPGYPATQTPIGQETGGCPPPVRIGYRSFDRQWIIPDKRMINRPNPTLWAVRSERQVYLTAPHTTVPSSGPAVTFSALIPNLDHYKGSFGGRAYPLWLDSEATQGNTVPGLLSHLSKQYGRLVTTEDVFAYLAAVCAHPGYPTAFAADLEVPGIRVPLTADADLFTQAAEIGARVIWLHSYGQRFVDPAAGRPHKAPRMDKAVAPRVAAGHAIPSTPDEMPDRLDYDATTQQLRIGAGVVENVTTRMWSYDVSGVNVLGKWFSYRRRTRDRPVIGGRRVSPLQEIQAETWQPEYTSELIDLLNVLGLLTELEPRQAELLDHIVEGPQITVTDLTEAGVLPVPDEARKPSKKAASATTDALFDVDLT